MLLVERDTVCRLITPIRSSAEFATDRHLCRETDDPDTNLVTDQGVDCLVDIPRVGRKEGTEDDENFSCAMTGCMTVITN